MNSITSNAIFRQRVVKYANKNGVTKASNRYQKSRQSIYRWLKKYDGTLNSLKDGSRRPKSHPNQHTEEEKKMILNHYPRYKNDLILLWYVLKNKGYKRKYGSLVRVVNRWIKPEKKKKKKRVNKPYTRADYMGQKVQVDVKYVPKACISNGKKYYQYTAIDECSRWTFRELYEEHSTYSSRDFLIKLIQNCPFPIKRIQTDNGTEFTNAYVAKKTPKPSLFEATLELYGIEYQRIRVATPRHNGKVERQHRADGERFYSKMKMYSLEDGRTQLKKYNKKSNNIPKTCINLKIPNEIVLGYLGVF